MPRPRLQFRLSTLLWLTLAVACWFGGAQFGHRRALQETVIDVEHTPSGVTLTKYADGRLIAEVETNAGSEFFTLSRVPDGRDYYQGTASDGTPIVVRGR
jgi:hypothetical protein